jgi:hypothetical protein
VGEGVEKLVGVPDGAGLFGPLRVGLGGGRAAQAVAGRADAQRGRRQLHVKRRRCRHGGRPGRRRGRGELEGAKLLQLALEAPVLLGERVTAALQELAVHFCLLQLGPARVARKLLMANIRFVSPGLIFSHARTILRGVKGKENMDVICTNLARLFWNHTSTCRGLRFSCLAKATFCFFARPKRQQNRKEDDVQRPS